MRKLIESDLRVKLTSSHYLWQKKCACEAMSLELWIIRNAPGVQQNVAKLVTQSEAVSIWRRPGEEADERNTVLVRMRNAEVSLTDHMDIVGRIEKHWNYSDS